MDTPNNKAGEITEKIMLYFRFFKNKITIETTCDYNRLYEYIYKILNDELK